MAAIAEKYMCGWIFDSKVNADSSTRSHIRRRVYSAEMPSKDPIVRLQSIKLQEVVE
eukprot:CAMPEP_0197428184 /NCGR_PEP_ID=MMETSP1170-20131217/40306_1 /TAXON_ID=54406 /ORGANISM="Sarcinochrysis sp, Strain CCMP770" /LENGTH=56 /DNA_ID=CAMNT_0042955915 /DNA_START=57 /DNA_END=224 /DNA_ORIENTATION=+